VSNNYKYGDGGKVLLGRLKTHRVRNNHLKNKSRTKMITGLEVYVVGGRLHDFCLELNCFLSSVFYFSTLSAFKPEAANSPIVSRQDKMHYRKQDSGMAVSRLEEFWSNRLLPQLQCPAQPGQQ
jgi:hypothetical protein